MELIALEIVIEQSMRLINISGQATSWLVMIIPKMGCFTTKIS